MINGNYISKIKNTWVTQQQSINTHYVIMNDKNFLPLVLPLKEEKLQLSDWQQQIRRKNQRKPEILKENSSLETFM